MSRIYYGGNRSENDSLSDDYNIEPVTMQLEAVRVGGILPRNRRERVPDAVYSSLGERNYRWDITVQCEFTAERSNARARAGLERAEIKIENITMEFPEAQDQRYMLVPADTAFDWRGRRIENIQQDRPRNAVAGSMRYKFRQDLHLFKIRALTEDREPDEAFWHAFRNFIGYQRIRDERYRHMEMVMKVHIHTQRAEDVIFWNSTWYADETPFEICSLSENDSEKKRLVYTTNSHWIDGWDK